MNYQIRFFRPEEFACPCCGRILVAVGLVLLLDILRARLGRRLIVTSGHRCVAHNAEVHGAETSRHLIGAAADLRPVVGMSYTDFAAVAGGVFAFPGCEAREYPEKTHVHVAIPRESAGVLWNGGDIHVGASGNFRK